MKYFFCNIVFFFFIDYRQILCNELLEAVCVDEMNQDWYYTLLTDHVCSGNLTNLSPSVAQMLVAYLERKDHRLLENVLLSLDVTCLDLHQVIVAIKTLLFRQKCDICC